MSLSRLYLYAQLAVFVGFMGFGYGAPARMASMLGMTLTDVTAIADFSATYGGLCAAVAVVLFLGATRGDWERPALTLAIATSAGLFVGRLLTVAQHGPAGVYIHGSMALEAVSMAAGVWLLRAGARRTA